MKIRNLFFLIAKHNTFLQLLYRGWVPQDLFFEGGPDFIALKGSKLLRFKIRYATKGDSGFIFSVGAKQTKNFLELAVGSDFLVFVCLEKKAAVGFYIFPKEHLPKSKTFLHPKTNPFPKYVSFYNNWRPLEVPMEV